MTGHDAAEPAVPLLLRPRQVQALLGIGRTTVHDLAAAGQLLVGDRTPGGHRRYRADSPALHGRLEASRA